MICRRAISNRLMLFNTITLVDNRNLIDAGTLVRANKFLQLIAIDFTGIRANLDGIRRDFLNRARMLC